jgi:hypothetical protein
MSTNEPNPEPSPSPSPTDSTSSFEDLGNLDFDDVGTKQTTEEKKEEESVIENFENTPTTTTTAPAPAATPTKSDESKTSEDSSTLVAEETKDSSPAATPVKVAAVAATSPASASFDLLYWKNPKDSGLAFSVGLMFFYMFYRGHSMLSLASLAVALNLIVNGTFNLLKMTPLKTYVENRSIPTVLNFLDAVTTCSLCLAFQKLFFSCGNIVRGQVEKSLRVANIAEFLKMMLCSLTTYKIGQWFSPVTLFMYVFVLAFTAPKLYEMFQTEIDEQISIGVKKFSAKYEEIVKSNDNVETFLNYVTQTPAKKSSNKTE